MATFAGIVCITAIVGIPFAGLILFCSDLRWMERENALCHSSEVQRR